MAAENSLLELEVSAVNEQSGEVQIVKTASKERRRMSCQSSVRNKGKLAVALRQKCRLRARTKFWSY